MTLYVPTDDAYNKLTRQQKFEYSFYLNRLYGVVLHHWSLDEIFPSKSLRDGLVLPVGLNEKTFVNVRQGETNGVSFLRLKSLN